MLSSNAQQAVANHRRQNSTPVGMNATGPPVFAHTNHHQAFHRRGMSTGYSAHIQDLGSTNHDEKVSTNHGQTGQHTMRAAQTPATSRPGHTESFFFEDLTAEPSNQDHWEGAEEFIHLPEDTEMPESYVQFPASDQANVSARNQEVAQHDDQATDTILKLMNQLGNLPSQHVKKALAEIGSKYDLLEKVQQHLGSSSTVFANTGTSNLATSSPMKRGQSWQEQMGQSRTKSMESKVPTPPHTVPLRCSATFDVASYPSTTFLDVSDLKFDLSNAVSGYSSSNYSPMSNRSGLSSFQSSPELAPISLFSTNGASASDFGLGRIEEGGCSSPPASPDEHKDTSRKAGDNKGCSDDEMTFNPNDFLIPSSVTEEEINAFVQGPDESGKYQCLYENCKNAPFGRKENIRAHVQTHLDDRRYKCDACNNKFVRPNDLKRHWQIHVNKRDFKCFCGAAFNRHDALKRHRERSEWCESSGTRGSPDSPKKDEKKRGRPKKIAPTESHERRERKAFIRREVRKKQEAASAASSVVSSQPSPPAFFDFADYQGAQPEQQMVSPSHTSLTPPASPRDRNEHVYSAGTIQPSDAQRKHSLSPPPTRDSMLSFGLVENKTYDGLLFGELEPKLPVAEMVPAIEPSQRGSPPALDLESSSPRFLDFDFGSDRPLLSQDTGLGSDSAPNGLMTHDDFDQISRWFGEESGADPMMGINPNKMHLSLTLGDNADPLFW